MSFPLRVALGFFLSSFPQDDVFTVSGPPPPFLRCLTKQTLYGFTQLLFYFAFFWLPLHPSPFFFLFIQALFPAAFMGRRTSSIRVLFFPADWFPFPSKFLLFGLFFGGRRFFAHGVRHPGFGKTFTSMITSPRSITAFPLAPPDPHSISAGNRSAWWSLLLFLELPAPFIGRWKRQGVSSPRFSPDSCLWATKGSNVGLQP